MTRSRISILLFAGWLCLAPAAALAWGGLGHRAVAELAEQLILPSTREALQPLLAEAKVEHLADVASWADEVRDLPEFRYTMSYHFVNFPRNRCDLTLKTSCTQGDCIISVIERDRERLADRSLSVAERSEALKYLVHLVGDIHQPLHAGWFSDRGGNGFQVNLNGDGSNLHKVWDVALPAAVRAQASEPSLSQHLGRLKIEQSSQRSATEWALESCRLIGSAELYPRRRKLGDAYLKQMQPLAAERMALAARRLAKLLDQALGAPNGGGSSH